MIKRIEVGDNVNYEVTREDKRQLGFSLGSDLTGKQVDMWIRKGVDTTTLVQKTAIITDAVNGVFNIVITKDNSIDDYLNLPVGDYLYDIQIKTIANDGDRDTFQSGKVKILPQITTN